MLRSGAKLSRASSDYRRADDMRELSHIDRRILASPNPGRRLSAWPRCRAGRIADALGGRRRMRHANQPAEIPMELFFK
jgi:hypothetical protein